MQTKSTKEYLVTGLFTLAFLLGGFIHVVVDPWDFTSCIVQIYYSSLVLGWAVTINYRIVNERVRRLMLMTAGVLILAFFLQMGRYRVFEYFDTACRYFWYGYYIPVIFAPVLFLFVVLHLHLQEDENPGRYWRLILLPAILLFLIVMTNDLHQQVFVFTDGSSGRNGTYTHGWVFYMLYVWTTVVLILSLYLAIKKCRIPSIGKKLWMPLYFAFYGAFLALSILGGAPKVGGAEVWLFIECLAMVIIGMEEACIQLGLIPANSSYRTIAKLANQPFMISDQEGTLVYSAKTAQEMFQRTENVQVHTKPIRGGSVSWAVDLTERMALNREIEKVTEGIESRNEYLKTENALKEEQSRLVARNMLYNRITTIVSPQLLTIGKLLETECNDNDLARIAFYNAYIKRRSNMELLKSDQMHFGAEELASAIRESCEYLKLCGTYAMLHIAPSGELSADMQVFLYEAFELVVETCLDTLKLLLINITTKETHPVLRMTLQASDLNTTLIQNQIQEKGGTVRFLAEDEQDEMTIVITRQEGGSV